MKMFVTKYVRQHSFIEMQPLRSPERSPLDFYLWGLFVQLQFQIKGHFTNAFVILVNPFAIAPGPSKGCENPGSDVSIRELIVVKDILRFCLNSDLIKQK
jgi:hypothetical protein